ncbi:MAG: biotin transporter BioY [Candidatus Krumholzibacteria bacterium]|nr:biotin transporter BioY [Candidatus Krumholzibacteria bacterium]
MYSPRVAAAGCTFTSESSSELLRRVARILAFVIFTGTGAQLAVRLPFTPVPVTMQTLFVVLAGVTLGSRDGFFAMVSYLALGVSGIPVFAGFSFGPALIFGPTGGYLIAFPAAALLSGWIYERSNGNRPAVVGAALCGSALILLSGTLHLSLISGLSLGQTVPIAITPFVAGEVLKAFLAAGAAGSR